MKSVVPRAPANRGARMSSLVALTAAALALGGFLYGRSSAAPRDAPRASHARRAEAATAARQMRDAVRETIEREVPARAAPGELDPYLEELAQRARRRGAVSALDVQPGLEAIRRADLGEASGARQLAFSERMARLSAELRGRPWHAAEPRADSNTRDIQVNPTEERNEP